ncbi:DUF6115 domain-containing protein [Clostridium paraputrificum]|uniref:DUF6115 domain-containing protein n=1 Tax=Clostridium TaxID=1485 RepID=UPI003D34C681
MPILLVILGVILIFLNIKAIKKDESSFGNVLKYKEEDISDVEIQIGQIRKDIAESLTELQTEILDIRNTMSHSKEEKLVVNSLEEDKDDEREFLLGSEEGIIDNISKKGKTERIRELLELGLSEDEICEKLSLGKGEVLLVKGLFK